MSIASEARGVHQSDLIMRSAIIAALEDLRVNTWLLDYVFASLAGDDLTAPEYGRREIEAAKKWFLSTRVNVFMSSALNEPKLPAISITLLESVESDLTLGDVHYVPEQDDDRLWPALTDRFTPTATRSSANDPWTVTVPKEIGDALVIAPGQQLIDRAGKPHEILSVIDAYTFTLAAGTNADFTGTVIKGKPPTSVIEFESMKMKETYSLGCHVQGEQVHLTYLHTLLVFCLLRYKKTLLEARGFERTQLSSSDFRLNESFGSELVFSRHINISGHVTQVWPAAVNPKITAVAVQPEDSSDSWIPDDLDPLLLKL